MHLNLTDHYPHFKILKDNDDLYTTFICTQFINFVHRIFNYVLAAFLFHNLYAMGSTPTDSLLLTIRLTIFVACKNIVNPRMIRAAIKSFKPKRIFMSISIVVVEVICFGVWKKFLEKPLHVIQYNLPLWKTLKYN